MKMKIVKPTLSACLVCALGFGTAFAGHQRGECDVVSLTGSGSRLENGVIVGSETLTIIESGESIPVDFTAIPLGVTDFTDGRATFVSSHDFVGSNHRKLRFTTFDKITTIPLEGDPSCTKGTCGLVFTLVLEKGVGGYNCGQIVSGYDPTLTAFTSTLRSDSLEFNSVGKLCDCGPGREDARRND
jgi:hypothetical protein